MVYILVCEYVYSTIQIYYIIVHCEWAYISAKTGTKLDVTTYSTWSIWSTYSILLFIHQVCIIRLYK